MARPTWLVDSNRIATKIKSASGSCDPGRITWKSNPTRSCPSCHHTIDNSDVTLEWPGLPRGVKFDPSDQEIIWHLLAKMGVGNMKLHPFIDEFIPTVDEEDGICYTHPQNLPGVKHDGTVSHFFHRAIKAYNTGTRKRRKIHGDVFGDVRWHKTGRTKPVFLDGVQQGCKKIMVLYVTTAKGGKAEKANWVMHQYHLGTAEDEKEGEYVISKVFYQQQQVKLTEKFEIDLPEDTDVLMTKVDPVTPRSLTPDLPRAENQFPDFDPGNQSPMTCMAVDCSPQHHKTGTNELAASNGTSDHQDSLVAENQDNQIEDDNNNNNQTGEDPKWWDSESQHILDSQQLVEGLSLCDELLCSQSPDRDATENIEPNNKPSLSDYTHLGPEDLKKDLEECQKLVLDPANIEIDTPPDFRLSQLEFESQESFLAWGGSKFVD
ncbi:hypothetical protein NMG60_11009504 [Bertholletia excelsa]